jgi:hypothetical protein
MQNVHIRDSDIRAGYAFPREPGRQGMSCSTSTFPQGIIIFPIPPPSSIPRRRIAAPPFFPNTFPISRKTPGGVKNTSAPGQYPPPSFRRTRRDDLDWDSSSDCSTSTFPQQGIIIFPIPPPSSIPRRRIAAPPVFPNTFPISRGYSSAGKGLEATGQFTREIRL